MDRVTKELVLESYREAGLTPIRCAYQAEATIVGSNANVSCGCALTAVFKAKKPDMELNQIEYSIILAVSGSIHVKNSIGLDLTSSYLWGFIDGFDRRELSHSEDEDYLLGYNDGEEAARAVFDEHGKIANGDYDIFCCESCNRNFLGTPIQYDDSLFCSESCKKEYVEYFLGD